MKTFALIGAAGYVAPRHMRAIKAVGGELKVAFDPKDSVGIIDSYFPDADFFVEFERFDRHVDKLRRRGEKIDYVSICSPNYLHDAHCRFALRSDADAICEKPLVLNPWNIDAPGRDRARVRPQGIDHPAASPASRRCRRSRRGSTPRPRTSSRSISPTSPRAGAGITPRGRATRRSPEGSRPISACISSTCWSMCSARSLATSCRCASASAPPAISNAGAPRCAGSSRSTAEICPRAWRRNQTTYRSVMVDGETVDFSDGFTDLHTSSYQEILAGRGFGLDAVRPSIEIVSALRSGTPRAASRRAASHAR